MDESKEVFPRESIVHGGHLVRVAKRTVPTIWEAQNDIPHTVLMEQEGLADRTAGRNASKLVCFDGSM